ALLEETYKTVLMHRANWLRSVVQVVGGVVETRALGGRGTETFARLPRAKQEEAVRFLLDNAFTTPRKLLQPGLVNRFKDVGGAGLAAEARATAARGPRGDAPRHDARAPGGLPERG